MLKQGTKDGAVFGVGFFLLSKENGMTSGFGIFTKKGIHTG